MDILERAFQSRLIRRIKRDLPGCIVLKNDPSRKQGFPDLTVLYKKKWAVLECKRSENEHKQPNQKHYVEKLNRMGYSSFIFPENKDDVLKDLDKAFGRRRKE